jgi:hypothetical protein
VSYGCVRRRKGQRYRWDSLNTDILAIGASRMRGCGGPVFNVLNRLNLIYEMGPLLDEALKSAALGEQLLGSFRKLLEVS